MKTPSFNERIPRRSPRRRVTLGPEWRARRIGDGSRGAQQTSLMRGPLRWLLPLGGLLLAAAALTLRRVAPTPSAATAGVGDDPRAFVLSDADEIYRDPGERFELRLPPGWLRFEGEKAAPYDAIFVGPRDLKLAVQIRPLFHDDPELLYKEILKIQRDLGLEMHIRRMEHRGFPAVERTAGLHLERVRMLDVLVGRTNHHVEFSAPRADYDRYAALGADLLAAYAPLPAATSP